MMFTTFCSSGFCDHESPADCETIDPYAGVVSVLQDVLAEIALAAFMVILVRAISPSSFSFFANAAKLKRKGLKIESKQECSVVQDSPSAARCEDIRLFGTIKSFSIMHGYGFIFRNDVHDDVRFSMVDVESEDKTSLRTGAVVSFSIGQSSNNHALHVQSTFEGQLKWFDRANCYGFISCESTHFNTDIWFSMCDVLTPESCLQQGSSVRFDAYRGQNGKVRARRVRIIDPALLVNHVTGYVKFFIPEKGHGFITCKESQSDVWFSQEDVPCDHVRYLTAGLPLRFKLDSSNPKPRAREVEVVLLPEVNATVKSFSDQSGYGFVSCDGIDGDVWFAGAAVLSPQRRPLGPGMRVRVEVFQMEDGKYRAFRVHRWEDDKVPHVV
uniref:CSD domain-containing protein n=1 Tax=Noctiluca scintillans TaxID=2966 RepID=A0A7S1F110_NOCSC|mmetsp:Transcript_24912/g.65431  ORF Transcript_24912/g.65431 Transcript_24912/m.65431 type:complete len:384 (+) Transcript_24912:71-1222(+)